MVGGKAAFKDWSNFLILAASDTLFSVASALGPHSGRADPLVVEVEAALEHDVDHVGAAELVPSHIDAAFLPGVDKLVLAQPLASEHDAIMRNVVQIQDVLEAELHLLVLTA